MKYTVSTLEKKTATSGKQYIKATVKDEQGVAHNVTIFSTFPNFETITFDAVLDAEMQIENDPKYGESKKLWPLKENKPAGMGGGMAKSMEKKAQNIEKAQDRKEEGIRVSSTFRDASLITASMVHAGLLRTEMDIKEEWRKWREWFWNNYDHDEN